MDLHAATIDRAAAQEKFEEYREAVKGRHSAEDEQILRGYREVIKGNPVISLPRTLGAGGRDDHGLPRLAVARADETKCWLESCDYAGAVTFTTKRRCDGRHALNVKDVRAFAAGTLPELEPPEGRSSDTTVIRLPARRNGGQRWMPHHSNYSPEYRAIVPTVPPALRPAHSLAGYDILWEVDAWALDPAPPVDPALLKHIGGDLYAVMAVWDLTELERLVIAGRADA